MWSKKLSDWKLTETYWTEYETEYVAPDKNILLDGILPLILLFSNNKELNKDKGYGKIVPYNISCFHFTLFLCL